MSFEENIPTHRAELNRMAARKRAKIRDLEDEALKDIRGEISELEDKMTELEDEYDNILADVGETPEYIALVDELAAINDEDMRLRNWGGTHHVIGK